MQLPITHMPRRAEPEAGLTLLEMAVVLVILAMLVGVILGGQELIESSKVNSQIAQIQNYTTASKTFEVNYGYLPGDLTARNAAIYHFDTHGPYEGEGNGNGIIQGFECYTDTPLAPTCNKGFSQMAGEAVMFWVDLSKVGLIDGSFSTAKANTVYVPGTNGPYIWFPHNVPGGRVNADLYYPQGKLGYSTYVFVGSGGGASSSSPTMKSNGINYFFVEAPYSEGQGGTGHVKVDNDLGVSVNSAYLIDSKIDDGLPGSGIVLAQYGANGIYWAYDNAPANGSSGAYAAYSGTTGGPIPLRTNASNGTVTSCFDNRGVNGAANQYSIEMNGGAGTNCALTFKMQ